MELRRLRYFLVTAEELHMGRASEKLGIAQPALSQQIKVLESSLGVRLFERVGRGIRLTTTGEALLPEARATVAQAERATQVAQGASRGQIGKIEIGYVATAMLEPGLPKLLRDYRQRYPAVEIRLRKLPVLNQVEALHERRLDIGFVRGVSKETMGHLKVNTFSESRLMLAMAVDHPLRAATRLTLSRLSTEQFLVLQDSDLPGYFHAKTTALCRAAGFEPDVVLSVDDLGALIGLIGVGIGIALVPACVGDMASARIVCRPVAGLDDRLDLVSIHSRESRSPVLDNFVDLLRKESDAPPRARGLTSTE